MNTEFKEGDYIVQLHSTESTYLIQNNIYKQGKNSNSLYTLRDSKGYTRNSAYVRFDNKDTWRYATQKEIEEYKRIDKPYDVTTLKDKIYELW